MRVRVYNKGLKIAMQALVKIRSRLRHRAKFVTLTCKTLTAALLLGICTSSMAVDNPKLLELQTQIDQLQKKLSQTTGKKTSLHQQLSQTKQHLEQALAELQKTQLQLLHQQHLYQKFNQEQIIHQQQLHTHQTLLTQQLRAIYKLLIANPSNFEERMVSYCRYLQQDRLQHIQKLQQSLQQITQDTQQIGQKTQVLQHLQREEQQNHLALETSRLQHQNALQSLSLEIQAQNQQLQQLVINKQNLQGVLTNLQYHPQMSFLSLLKQRDFGSQQGKLTWPTQGPIIEHFGAPIGESQLKWTDILIQAPAGQYVRAVAGGKVVFANAMVGYGLLLIIDHGNGYMSLYGHNQNLYKKVGDVIKAGELIATVGHAENETTTALYFGIRHNGKPLNPEQWCV
jgi:septal ring factor EnvC (AmiA/AmiB activator)